ncbi:hypothetical protein TraAM80_00891 [Trypanosoma rangeli]|uniref:Uncharacterized protein n=1 Tax=Trypanosoma rangeli TaxID=5698 RepID=A0A422P190_TRYRA|nr:uncharacterized protein TraAM80_00891 [Trypanosoma rangeli]RNF11445.1 hypothetical protein TraAM80_00891 [Trypanosoma rangeli]|eukprot:RNF11445.1 hypothetical protein TraAM80_00891 [Trypanosoma rangeli]
MSPSIVKAIETVNRYIAGQQGEVSAPRDSNTSLHPPLSEGYQDPQRRILPAFRETWRGGPNVIAPDHGSCFVSVDCLWHDRNRISEEVKEVVHQKGNTWDEEKLASMFTTCARCAVDATPALGINWPRERDLEGLIKDSIRDKVKLGRSCRMHHIHGALGLQESPYGHAGEVYVDAQQRLSLARSRTICPLKRQVQHTKDSLFGSIALRQSVRVRCKGGVQPDDHLFATMYVEDAHVK